MPSRYASLCNSLLTNSIRCKRLGQSAFGSNCTSCAWFGSICKELPNFSHIFYLTERRLAPVGPAWLFFVCGQAFDLGPPGCGRTGAGRNLCGCGPLAPQPTTSVYCLSYVNTFCHPEGLGTISLRPFDTICDPVRCQSRVTARLLWPLTPCANNHAVSQDVRPPA